MVIAYEESNSGYKRFKEKFFKELREKEQQDEARAGTPRLGIFWLHKEKGKIKIFYSEDKSLDDCKTLDDITYPSIIHKEVWAYLKKHDFVPMNSAFTDLPRGRVVYNTKTKKYIVIFGKYLLDNYEAKNIIRADFNLDSSDTEYDKDKHYEEFTTWIMEK